MAVQGGAAAGLIVQGAAAHVAGPVVPAVVQQVVAAADVAQAVPVQNGAQNGAHHSFKFTPFTPNHAASWVNIAERTFTAHGIVDENRKMLEIVIALNEELRSLTDHITENSIQGSYQKLIAYLRGYRARSQIERERAMVVSRPIGDRKPSEHLHALRLEFGIYPNNTSLLRRIFEDSLHTNIATLFSVEHIADI